jgi:glycosyltransferase involved in cell wall biosynthesis
MRHSVLLIGTFPEPTGGISIHLARLRSFLEAGDVTCRTLDESTTQKNGVPNMRRLSPLAYVRLLRSCDIVHIHTSHPAMRLLHTLCARLLLRRVVLTVHSLTAPGRSRIASILYRLSAQIAHKCIYVSDTVRKGLDGAGPIIPAFLRPDVNEERAPAHIAQWIFARQAEGRTVLASNASRLNWHKGQDLYGLDLMLDVLTDAEISQEYACVFVVSSLQGGRAYYEACQRRIAEAGLAQHFLLISERMPFAGLLKAADIMVRATNTDGDALSVREALWYGKPVVASDCAQRPDGVTLFRTRDAASLKQAIIEANDARPPEGGEDFGRMILSVYEQATS